MSNSFIMTESIVRPAKMPYGRLKDNGFVGIEGEHAARALVVETKDDLSAFASINLIIDDLDCGAMTKTTSGGTTTLSMTLTSSMIGRSGRKICQLIMVNSGNTVVQKSSQFEAYVGRANEIERSVDDGVTIIILSEAVTEMAREAAAAAAEEAVADVVEDCQAIADAASASADAAAQSASDAQTAAASITVDAALDPTSTHAIQNKAVASEISSIKADLCDTNSLLLTQSDAVSSSALTIGQYRSLENNTLIHDPAYAFSGSLNTLARKGVTMTNADYEFAINCYSSTPVSSSNMICGIGWCKANSVIVVPKNTYAIICQVKKISGSISESETDAIKAAFIFFVPTDKTLYVENKAADAKITGDAIRENREIINTHLSAYKEDSLTAIPFKQKVLKGKYIRESDGVTQPGTKYARTSLIDVGDSKCISISNADYQMRVAYYSEEGDVSTGSGYLGNSDYVDSFKDVDFPSDAVMFGVTFRKTDQTDLADSDVDAIADAINIKTVKANAALNAVDGLATEYAVVNKDIGVIIDYYSNLAKGEISESNLTVKTLCLPCKPCETYRIRHPKSTQFVVASYVTQPRLGRIAQKVYNGRYETVTVFTTDEFATWLGIYYYSSANSNTLTPEETYDVLTIEKGIIPSATPSCYTVNNAIALPTTYEDVIALYDGLVSARPDYVTKNALTSGDLTNYEYVFSTGNYNKYTGAKRDPDPAIVKPTILLTSGVHGYERSAVVSLYLLMRDLCSNNYALTDLINYVNIRVIPVGCPWGYTNNSRLNANGVNINRNFATSAWGDTDPETPGSADYAGPSAGSEDETKIIQNWMQAYSNALFYIDFHNSNFRHEVVTLGGPDTEECTLFKKRFLLAINKTIPYWQKERGMDSDDNMYYYAGGSDTIQGNHSRHYAYEVGIHKAFYYETSWNINGTGKHSIETFLVGAEAMGNFLVGMKKYYEEI